MPVTVKVPTPLRKFTAGSESVEGDGATVGALVDDLEGRVEREESLGINQLADLTWNHILDLYTCTECGRCSDNCPAYTTGKKLSPKHLTLALRDHLYDLEPHFLGTGGIEAPRQLPGKFTPLGFLDG